MGVTKDEKRRTWTVQCWYHNWTGERCKKMKRGFPTKRAAQKWEHDFLAISSGEPTMSFGEFCKTYEADIKPRLKLNTWQTKEHIIRTKLLPYFEDKPINEISGADILNWENELMNSKTSSGAALSQTYLHTVCNQLSAVFNHAVRFYNLSTNPVAKVGKVGTKKSGEMQFWTKEEYLRFSSVIMDKPVSFTAFEVLYWTGIREGELLALTPSDFDFDALRLSITKSYQRIKREDVITSPKTQKSIRTIDIPQFLADEVAEFIALEGIEPTARIFDLTKSALYHEMDRGSTEGRVKRIRVHDLRHSHASLLIEMGFGVLAIADRLGHESIDITYRYAHLFPEKKNDIANRLEAEGSGR